MWKLLQNVEDKQLQEKMSDAYTAFVNHVNLTIAYEAICFQLTIKVGQIRLCSFSLFVKYS